MGRLSRSEAPAPGARQYAPTGRGGGGGRQNARHGSESVATGSGGMDVCLGERGGTNNRAERPLRRAVLWRRRRFGTQSEGGSQFVERSLTAVTTLRQQRRDVLDYLTAACTAAIRTDPAPSLLPLTSPPLSAR